MPTHRVRLIHWNKDEAKPRIAALRAAGYAVDFSLPMGPELLRALKERPPAAFVIDLSRLPSHGRDVALALREMKATRHIPLVFAEGDPEKVERIRQMLPDAVYTVWSRIRGDLKRAIARPPAAPVVPRSRLEGYSGTPLPKKLGIQPGLEVALLGAPRDFRKTLGALPERVRLRSGAGSSTGLVLWFLRSRRELDRGMRRMATRLGAGKLWMCWPKKASGVVTDLTEQFIREAGLAVGLVDYKICAVDATWSGLLFTRRKARA